MTSAPHSSPTPSRRALQVRQVVIDLSVLIVIGIVLGLLAPLGTGSMSVAGRVAYWVVLAVAGYLFYRPIGSIALRLGRVLDLPVWALWIGSVLLASVPMAILVWIVNAQGVPASLPAPDVALSHYLAVCLVGGVVTVMMNVLSAKDTVPATQGAAADETNSSGGQEEAPRFTWRLRAELGTDVLALEMEDHYVRAHTPLGSELVLLRMRDAVAEMSGVDGAQVHRSWWVARGAVRDVTRDGRNVRLVLDNGLEVPVSRANVTPLRDAGWL